MLANPAFPSTRVAALTLSFGSTSVSAKIVPVPVAVPSECPADGSLNTTEKVWPGSNCVSPFTFTTNGISTVFAGMVRTKFVNPV